MFGSTYLMVTLMTLATMVHAKSCTTRTGAAGRCIYISKCPDLKRILKKVRAGTAPQGTITMLRESVCDIVQGVPKVCCEENPQGQRATSLLPSNCGRTILEDRIVNGVNASLFAWPWITLLRGRRTTGESNSVWICGGVLISDRYVLTAAHCVHTSSSFTLEFVRAGEHRLSENPDCERRVCAPQPQDITVEEITVHEGYQQVLGCASCHDIALLRLSQPAQLNPVNVVPACLPFDLEGNLGVTGGDFSSKFAWTAGWGTTNFSSNDVPDVLQEALLPLGNTFCRINSYPDPNMVLCAGGAGVDACRRDSGGPLIMNGPRNNRGYVVGLVSQGPSVCGAPQTQGVYTNVNHYISWILGKLRP